MPLQTPGMFGATHCTTCGQRVRGPNHVCQPSAIQKFKRINAWAKKSQAAGQPQKKK